ncbi:hypothetical protein, partial [Salmonella sp. s51228]|uniref:hypothetical protein n=1 Tax=Salmonella sp. s51228 TaxID=3159652 RepID=UPI00397F317C
LDVLAGRYDKKNIFAKRPRDDEIFNIEASVQFSGYLNKRPFGSKGKTKKWKSRFFVIKEGFLLYYTDHEGREFEKKHKFNMHPKGVLPLGGCEVELISIQDYRFSLSISHPRFVGGSVAVAAFSQSSQTEWHKAISDCSKAYHVKEDKDQLETDLLGNKLSRVTDGSEAIIAGKLT